MEVAIVIEVTLQDCTGIDLSLKERAEARFQREIEKFFPDEQSMLDAWRAYADAAEGGPLLCYARRAHGQAEDLAGWPCG